MAKCIVTIEGHGTIVIKHPKKINKKTLNDTIALTVAETLSLMFPKDIEKRFHPVLGIGGYGGSQPVPASDQSDQ